MASIDRYLTVMTQISASLFSYFDQFLNCRLPSLDYT